ncbi:MAG TPA: DUF3127 domain-containing protein [Cyclobacteriaceae bacterium]|nr:DUF3127 domain-containing protein [Cyclobacteriaceae bacterium]HMV08249.1 DUF3127 domain-containing protein [Cyclobacteriaceae bacterium]HMV91495.1 DUF3127 domain-containing protein [Cyclobacteriaceae bacterium]HMX02092.1 DUF3127 domain-containing protein [Cyclobacteriaceae bacterium]HMX49932.1 DUF3127 domain-containing protein [Cyclobacteriaceae bacterium]
MEITGTVVSLLPMQSGQGKNGTWKKQEFIIETPGQYPKKVCLSLWGEKVDETRLSVGEKITASINIESREYNGRWYTDVRAWKIAKGNGGGQNEAPPIDSSFAPDASSGSDDLPF